MAEYIEREAAMLQINAADFVRDDNFEGGATLLFCDDVVDRLSAIPAADVRPVVHGEWLRTPTFWAYCSVCGEEPPKETNITTNYCPNCGARMEESRWLN